MFSCFSLVISQSGVPKTDVVEIAAIAPNSPAEENGLIKSDIITAIDGIAINNLVDVAEIVQDNLGHEITISILRGDDLINVNVIPRANPPKGEGAIGILMQNPLEPVNYFESLPFGWQITIEQGKQLLSLPSMLIHGEINPQDARMLSPKGIFDVYSQVREEEKEIEQGSLLLTFQNISWFFALISVSLGFSNLLPIPALDGGRILFIIPEILFKKRVPAKYENFIHLIGYSGLIILMGYTFFQDIINPIVLP